jgi:hypothetical protein
MVRRGSRLAEVLSWLLLALAVIMGLALAAIAIAAVGLALGSFGGELLANLAPENGSGVAAMTVLLVVGTLTISAALGLLLLMRRVLVRVARGDPFHRRNPRDLQLVAALLAVLEVVSLIAFLVVPLFVTLPPEIVRDMRTDFDPDLTSWLAVFIILVLAEVFREGARLQTDAELTV